MGYGWMGCLREFRQGWVMGCFWWFITVKVGMGYRLDGLFAGV